MQPLTMLHFYLYRPICQITRQTLTMQLIPYIMQMTKEKYRGNNAPHKTRINNPTAYVAFSSTNLESSPNSSTEPDGR